MVWLRLTWLVALGAVLGAQAQTSPGESQGVDQSKMLESSDPVVARNKKVVYELWRTTISAGHVEFAPDYMAPGFVDHNPNVPPGLKGYMEILGKALKPIAIPHSIKGLVDVIGEQDRVVLVFQNEWSAAASGSPLHDEPNSFELFRVQGGKVVEHWDSMPAKPKANQPTDQGDANSKAQVQP